MKRIVHLPCNHGSLATRLSAAERALGHHSISMASANRYAETATASIDASFAAKLSKWRAAREADILFFNFGSSLFDPPYRRHFLFDVPFYPKSQKRGVFYQGSDLRMKYQDIVRLSREIELSLGHKLTESTRDGIVPANEIERKQKRLQKMKQHTDRLFFLNPDLATELPDEARFLPYPFANSPRHISQGGKPSQPESCKQRPLRVAHLSTNRVLKGTGLIEAAVAEAKRSANITFKVGHRIPKDEAQALIEWCDVFVDQVCLGWYGMQAVEALAMGKPTIAWLEDRARARYLADWPEQKSGLISSQYQSLANLLVSLAEDHAQRDALSSSALEFVNTYHNPEKIVTAAYGDWF